MSDINLSQLREILEWALDDAKANIQLDQSAGRDVRSDDIEQRDRIEKLLAALPKCGTVIIDSRGMAVVPFEVGDTVWILDRVRNEKNYRCSIGKKVENINGMS